YSLFPKTKMFNKITLRNYRTHKSTTLELKPITLLIGNNGSGKTNFLSGIQHFSQLIRRGNPFKQQDRTVLAKDYFPHRYRLANDEDFMSVEIEWSHNNHFVKYYMELYKNDKFSGNVGCKEKLELKSESTSNPLEFNSGYKKETNSIELRSKISNYQHIKTDTKEFVNDFFRDFANTFSYHLQPSFLKGIAVVSRERENPAYLGHEGSELSELICLLKNQDEKAYSRFLKLIRSFDNNKEFEGVSRDNSQFWWEFDLGKVRGDRLIEKFPTDAISNGFLKAAAIAFLASAVSSPALILIEEIENGINPGNLQELFYWLWQTTSPRRKDITVQLIVTSHSPAVLREFNENLDSVYIFALHKRNYETQVTNLTESLDFKKDIGLLEGELIEEEFNGERFLHIPKYRLAELWYSGSIG
ncbi:MAG: AAA family ATPase, partial [Okeania sp. SIO2H7]|nr:AAA family ATPase [Okeania sp. SIO2H7]